VAVAVLVVALAAAAGMLVGGWSTDDEVVPTTADQPIPAGPGDYEATLLREVAELADSRSAELQQLREAREPAEQASASEELVRAYRLAAERLARIEVPASLRRDHAALIEALRRASDAYERMGAAATEGRRSAYDAARDAVRRAEALSRRRLGATLSAAGSPTS
jgi:hypothetical protein